MASEHAVAPGLCECPTSDVSWVFRLFSAVTCAHCHRPVAIWEKTTKQKEPKGGK